MLQAYAAYVSRQHLIEQARKHEKMVMDQIIKDRRDGDQKGRGGQLNGAAQPMNQHGYEDSAPLSSGPIVGVPPSTAGPVVDDSYMGQSGTYQESELFPLQSSSPGGSNRSYPSNQSNRSSDRGKSSGGYSHQRSSGSADDAMGPLPFLSRNEVRLSHVSEVSEVSTRNRLISPANARSSGASGASGATTSGGDSVRISGSDSLVQGKHAASSSSTDTSRRNISQFPHYNSEATIKRVPTETASTTRVSLYAAAHAADAEAPPAANYEQQIASVTSGHSHIDL